MENKLMKSSSSSLNNLRLNTNKAGMEGLNIEKINEIIKKASEGSKYYQHKQKCQERIDIKIIQMKAITDQYTDVQIAKAELEMNALAQELELERDLTRTIVHIDMDMFYAAVEMRDDPLLRDIPMAVGSNSMLSTSNYIARKFGVRAAMPGFIAKKLCPHLVIVSTNFDKYRAVSREVQEIFKFYDPNFSPMSLDEAYLDITNYLRTQRDDYEFDEDSVECTVGEKTTLAEVVVEEIREKIKNKTQLTASAGIAVNTLLSKVCSDMNKPNGQFYLAPKKETIDRFIEKLPIRKVSGIGNVTEQLLNSVDVTTCSDLWKKRGLGSTEISASEDRDRKSISTETTFQGTTDRNVLLALCSNLCKELAEEMVKKNLIGKVFTLKIKTSQFEVRTRAQTLMEPTRNESILGPVCRTLLIKEMDNEPKDRPLSLRLIGVRMSSFVEKSDSKKQTILTDLFSKAKTNDIPVETQQENCNSSIPSTSELSVAQITDEAAASDDVDEHLSETIHKEVQDLQLCPVPEIYTCPICSSKRFTDIGILNLHMDECLNKGLLKQLVKESNELAAESTRRTSIDSTHSEPSSAITEKRKKQNTFSPSKRRKCSSNILTKFLGLN